ncbi:hypothetical protein QJS10_CPB11g00901 [Acorus calamus]|uniref:Uncharacterized protein n=1 Tax=Acorus calamus TaxID=4465 RepID=A0AAV9DV41_ACOCL|nr:hypothetical protein QJS10_CPB11g00901 [Acorus calamus]
MKKCSVSYSSRGLHLSNSTELVHRHESGEEETGEDEDQIRERDCDRGRCYIQSAVLP